MKRTRLRPVGRIRQRWANHQMKCRRTAELRAAGHCEACRLWYGQELQHHHTFGRGEEPWSSELGVMLCDPCHTSITDERNPRLKEDMRFLALNSLATRRGIIPVAYPSDFALTYKRTLIQTLEGAA